MGEKETVTRASGRDEATPRLLIDWLSPAPSSSAGRLLVVGVLLTLITTLHLYTDPGFETLHLVYRRLYYFPILYAAYVFGLGGGLVTAVASSLLLIPVLFGDRGVSFYGGVVNEMFMYVVIGVAFGWLRDTEESRTRDLRQVSHRLEEAYAKLEERAVELMNIQEYTQAILSSITAAVVTVGPDGSITTANSAAERMLGLSEDEMVPRPFASVFSDDGGLGREVDRVLSARVPRSHSDTTFTTGAGAEVHAQVASSMLREVGGRVLGAVVTIEDVSEIKALTEQLIRADRLAAMGELTAGVAHEVRNPLGIIRASIQLLRDEGMDRDRFIEALAVIDHEIGRLDRVVKALLDFGRPSSPTLVVTDLDVLLEEVVLFTGKFASRSDVEIVRRSKVPSLTVDADPDQLKQVFVNLISNAVQAMEGEGGRLLLEADTEYGFAVVRVTDTGPGMEYAVATKVFDPFFSTRDDGTGLGLTIVHRILDEHGGHIELETGPGEGSTFTVRLPMGYTADAGGLSGLRGGAVESGSDGEERG
jgi:two-component system sensor histidine kinase AtoS